MSRRGRDGTYRERWIDAVLWTDSLTPVTKNLLVAMSRHMDERGRVRRKHADLAAALQIQNAKHVGDRIREARDKGFLSQLEGTGLNRTVSAYDAMIPAKERANAPLSARASSGHVPGNGGRENGCHVTGNGGRETGDVNPACRGQFTSPDSGDHYARATETNREQELAPVGSGVSATDYLGKNGSNGDPWQPAPSKCPFSDSRRRVA